MKVVLVCTSKFHFLSLARQLHERQMLSAIFTGYPHWKLKGEGIPRPLIRSFPWIHALFNMRMRTAFKRKNSQLDAHFEWLTNRALDAYAATFLPECDVVMTISNMGLRTGQAAQRRGGVYVCDRPCSHVRTQDQLLREEHARFGVTFAGIDKRSIQREEQEYREADCVVVSSSFSRRSFEAHGIFSPKVRQIALGVDLTRFKPVATPDADTFDVLFAGAVTLRKGLPYLLEGFEKVKHPRKRLRIVGTPTAEVIPMLEAAKQNPSVEFLGHVAQDDLKDLMSRSHVFALPTIEDGFGMVMAEAMACGCPVISTTNSGAPDLYDNNKEGFIIPIRDSEELAARFQALADSPSLRAQMSTLSLQRVQDIGGWNTYGSNIAALFEQLVSKTPRH